MTGAELRSDPWAFGPWCFVVGEVIPIDPIPNVRGMLGFWAVPGGPLPGKHLGPAAPARRQGDQPGVHPVAAVRERDRHRSENRPQKRRIPTGGLWVAIHAGKADYPLGADLLTMWRMERSRLANSGLWREAPATLAELPHGAIIGAMRLDQCLAYPEVAERGPGLFRYRPMMDGDTEPEADET